jgi:hypothetical protein
MNAHVRNSVPFPLPDNALEPAGLVIPPSQRHVQSAGTPIINPANEIAIEFCHTGCGRIATAVCECGNAVCTAHRYNADGEHDPAGSCSACYDEVLAQRLGGC